MPDKKAPADSRLQLLRNARREAVIVLCVWAAFLVWAVGYSCLEGYTPAAEGFRTVAGIPHWVFYGIALPWLAATLFTIVFGARLLQDDDLGEERGEGKDGHGRS